MTRCRCWTRRPRTAAGRHAAGARGLAGAARAGRLSRAAGQIVDTIAPHTEADPVAILTQLLVAFGAAVGRGAWFAVEATRHHPNEFLLLVGDSAKARKGSSWDHVRRLLDHADPTIGSRTLTGLSSGEGLIWAVRDPSRQRPRRSATGGCWSSSPSSPASSRPPRGRSRRSRRRCARPGTGGRWRS